MKKITNNKGITLIALIITIIVMLILVAVTVSVAINGELFSKSKYAAQKTEENAIYERILGALKISDDGKINVKETYNEIENMFDTVELIEPKEKTAVRKTAVFEITGKQGTYTYTTTEKELIIGKPEEIIIEKTEISENSLKLRITPVITADLFTEEEACQLLGCNNVGEFFILLYNSFFEENPELTFESFEDLAAAKRSEETGLIVLEEIPEFGTIAPFKDEYEGLKNIFKTAFEDLDGDIPDIETVQDYVAYMFIYGELETEKVLKINGENVSRDVTWDDIVATYSVYNPSTYKIEIDLVLGDIEKTITRTGEITIGKIGSYVGKNVYYSGINWTVLYDDDEHGIQLISDEALGDGVTLGGYASYDEAVEEYNNLINKLKDECSKVVTDQSKVIDIRNVGAPSEEINTYYSSDLTWFDQYEGKIKNGDEELFNKEIELLRSLNLCNTANQYWVPVRVAGEDEPYDGKDIYFHTCRIFYDNFYYELLFSLGTEDGHGKRFPAAETYKVRPVITIDPSVEWYWNQTEGYFELGETTKVSHLGKDVKYDGKDWKVLYEDDSHGLQLISMQAMGSVSFGGNIEGYNNAITKLNTECSKLISDKSAVSTIRNVGGPATDPITDTTYTFPNNFFNNSSFFNTYNNKLKVVGTDSYYTEDHNRMNELNILRATNSKSSSYWMGARYIDTTTSINDISFNVRRVSPAGEVTYYRVISINKNGNVSSNNYNCQLRPVITIKPEYSLVKSGDYYTLAK